MAHRALQLLADEPARRLNERPAGVGSRRLVPIERKLLYSAAREGHEAVGRPGTGKVLLFP
jgi:hypothetical protein